MIQVTDPSMTAMIQNAPDFTRSMIEPETIEAVVQENSRKRPEEDAVEARPQGGIGGRQVGVDGLAAHMRRHQLVPRLGEMGGHDAAGDTGAVHHG